jgi:L-amino acid N-acyltransferase YncA
MGISLVWWLPFLSAPERTVAGVPVRVASENGPRGRLIRENGARIVKHMAEGSWSVRDSSDADVTDITQIYGHWVEHGLASFELVPPSPSTMAQRRLSILADGFPYLVAVDSGGLLGFGYASWYRARPAYRFACEDSVYVSPIALRRSVGRRLLDELVRRCTAMEFRLMVAVIGDSGNAPSIELHRSGGFEMAGVLPSIGWKHGRWVDTVLMVRPLGAANHGPPIERGRLGQN